MPDFPLALTLYLPTVRLECVDDERSVLLNKGFSYTMLDTCLVAIIGGGPVGLVASALLSVQNIPHVLFERHAGTSIHPKAVGINQRSMEVMRRIGLETKIHQHRAPASEVAETAWYTSLGPESKCIYKRKTNNAGDTDEAYRAASPTGYSILPQMRLEPLIFERAMELNADGVKFSTEVIELAEEEDYIALKVKDLKTGHLCVAKARYVIAADGGRFAADRLNIKYEGQKDLVDMVGVYIRAPLSLYTKDQSNLLTWLINPRLGGSIGTGFLYTCGPWPTRPDTEEYIFGFAKKPTEPAQFEDEDIKKRIREALEIPNLPIKINTLRHWFINAVVAERYLSRSGRTFLVGDAAHRIPPWGALGMNTGIQDVHNLIWKIAFALRGDNCKKYEALLATYDEERRPIGQRVAKTSLHNFLAHGGLMDKALGISPEKSIEENEIMLGLYLDHRNPKGDSLRAAVNEAQKVLDKEFHALGADVGWFYPQLDVKNEGLDNRHDGQLDDNGDFNCVDYYPSTIPGHHLPHAWLEKNGLLKSTLDLLPHDRFTLLTQSSGYWEHAASDVLKVEIIDNDNSWYDIKGQWSKLSGVQSTGAVLVRPDCIVVWRSQGRDATSTDQLKDMFVKLIFKILKVEE